MTREEIRREIFEYIREGMSIDISMDDDYECDRHYVGCSVEINLIHPDTGEKICVGHEYTSAYVGRD